MDMEQQALVLRARALRRNSYAAEQAHNMARPVWQIDGMATDEPRAY